jgi:hypothetical protein
VNRHNEHVGGPIGITGYECEAGKSSIRSNAFLTATGQARETENSSPVSLQRRAHRDRTLFPLTRLVLELVAWAREAPEIKPGRQ